MRRRKNYKSAKGRHIPTRLFELQPDGSKLWLRTNLTQKKKLRIISEELRRAADLLQALSNSDCGDQLSSDYYDEARNIVSMNFVKLGHRKGIVLHDYASAELIIIGGSGGGGGTAPSSVKEKFERSEDDDTQKD